MSIHTIQDLQEVTARRVSPDERLFSADQEEIRQGWTTDIYFVKTREILRRLELAATPVVAEVFAGRPGLLAGTAEVKNLLCEAGVAVWALPEGEWFAAKEVVLRIHGSYDRFGIYETALLGILASSSGWATAARHCKEAAGDRRVVCFGARHVHPAVAPVMERAAVAGGADGASCILGAKLAGQEPVGTVPHAVILITGDTVEVARAYKQFMPPGSPVIVLVDTFKDEAEEALRVAAALGGDLHSIRLDTPGERGGVTPALVREVRARLDQAGFGHVQILVSGGLTPERIALLAEAGADSFGVGSYISGAPAIDMTMDIKEVAGRPVAKRGRIPGITAAPRLQRIL
ncbi:nicotinate phosphoribosyltransferase [Desulfotomaculum copahuensis]|uniref:Nicotinate phosphoribosyltransferase n=1 Tax=Desulfotomaculum copahuensis TaxID=1838280 RepID=A0A1B7LEL0_9FIRM|nr:nicotinate phosphoribosyltransferase [Desulfotomaculum copahuensis]OAT81721.1 nicotinate phosphoribosyltransferase [Desulfotomaculum copahuensis]